MTLDQETLIEIDEWLQEELRATDFREAFTTGDLVSQLGELDPQTDQAVTALVEQRLEEWFWKRDGKSWRRLERLRKAKTTKLADGRSLRIRASWPKMNPKLSKHPRLVDAFERTMERVSEPRRPTPKKSPHVAEKDRELQEAEDRLAAQREADRAMMKEAAAFRRELAELQSVLAPYLRQ